MTGTWTYTESTNTVVVTGGTSGTPATFADFVAADRTVATTACSIASGAQLKAAAAVGTTTLTLTYPMRPVDQKALRLAITTAQNGGAAVSGDEDVDIYGTTATWHYLTGASASGQKVVPIANGTHNYQVGDTVILIDISDPTNYETDVIASISEGVSITLTNNNTNSYASGDVVGIYQTETIDLSAAFGTYWTTLWYGQVAKFDFDGFDGTNTAKIDQPIWGIIWNKGNGHYQLDCLYFNVGNGSTSTYFAASDGVALFLGQANGYIKFYANATLKFGEVDDATAQTGIKGCYLRGQNYLIVNSGNTSTNVLELYHCHLSTVNANKQIYTDTLNTIKMWDAVFDYGISFGTGSTNASLKNLIIRGSNYCIGALCDIDTASISGPYNFILRYGNRTYKNITAEKQAAEFDFLVDSAGGDAFTGELWAVNCNLKRSPWTFFNTDWLGNIYRMFSFDIELQDADGVALSGKTVVLKDVGGNTVFSEVTDANGNVTFSGDNSCPTDNTVTYEHYYTSGGALQRDVKAAFKLYVDDTLVGTFGIDDVEWFEANKGAKLVINPSVGGGGGSYLRRR